MATDYLCLGSGHNDMAETLSQYLEMKFEYEIDVVSLMTYIKLLYLSKKCKHLSVYYHLNNVFFCLKGTTKSLNLIFSNFWQMVCGWPDGHTFEHLKRQVLFNLIEHWETYATKLQQHLDKQPLSYKEAVLEINNCDQNEQIPTALGDFVLAAISLTTGIPIYVIYPSTERIMDPRNLVPVTKNGTHLEYLFRKDATKAKARTPDLVVMVYNGLDYYAPTMPIEIANMTRNCATASTSIEDATQLINDILKDLPSSSARDALSKSLKFMGAANHCLEGTSLATGTTSVACLLVDVPIPQPSSLSVVMKTAHKRAAAMIGEVPPEKNKGESDQSFRDRKKKYSEHVVQVAARDTKLAPNQCPCSESFNSFDELLQHQQNKHPDPTNWKCTHCDSISNNKGHCWSHARKHLGKYYFYCNCKYLDKKENDENGQPKEKICKKGYDEEAGVLYYRKVEHSVGKAKFCCDYCDRPQQSYRRKLLHHNTCDHGPNKDEGLMHWCDEENCGYSCRSAASLRNHMGMTHFEVLGLPAPKRWTCKHCGKIFKSANGHKTHDCQTPKTRKS